jgi:uncharacterized protein (DUF1015 family)
MALLYPFRGYRYSRDTVGDLKLVVTQPYNRISPALQKEYCRRSPYNVVRVTRSFEKLDNPETNYSEAALALQSWINRGALLQDNLPALYAYYQQFDFQGESLLRKGFIALLDLPHSAAGVMPHERILAELKMDRLRLLRSTECNEDALFMIYTEDRLKVNRILDETASARPAEFKVKDDLGVVHKLWAITDTKSIRRIQDGMVPEELFIADGLHRFDAALDYKRECAALGWQPAATESFNARMVACFNNAEGSMPILPTHRLICDLPDFDPPGFLQKAGKYFDVTPVSGAADLWEVMRKGRESSHVFGFYARNEFFLLRLKVKVDPLMLAHAEACRHLDVSILHAIVLDRLLGISESQQDRHFHVDFARDREACVQSVDEESFQAAFFLNPASVEQLQRLASLGERLPPMSTDFYPKLLTGLVFMKMQITKSR